MADDARVLDADRNKYERQSWESLNEWRAFKHYRDQGLKRKKSKVEGTCTSTCLKYAKRNHWDERCVAYDDWSDKTELAAHADELVNMQRRQLHAARELVEIGLHQLKLFKEHHKYYGQRRMTATAAAHLIKIGSDIERLNLGEPTDINKIEAGTSFAQLVGATQPEPVDEDESSPLRLVDGSESA